MRTIVPMTVLTAALACSLASAPAHARARVFVASYGNDSSPCTFGSPCKTFQQAHDVVDAGGEVTAIDSAGFGPINITKAVTITSPDGIEAGIVAAPGADAIDINAGPSDVVVLRGLTLNGGGAGDAGVFLNSGGSLTVFNCVVQNFGGDGIAMRPTSGTFNFAITNTIVSKIGVVGVRYIPPSGSPNANGVIDHVTVTEAVDGIDMDASNSAGGTTVVTISNSIASNNGRYGLYALNGPGPLTVSIDNVTVGGNVSIGIAATSNSRVLLGRSVITGNGVGIGNNSNTFYTYGNNQINLNPNGDITGISLLTTFKPQ